MNGDHRHEIEVVVGPPEFQSKGAAIVKERAKTYGSPVPNMLRFSGMIEAILGCECTALQATMIMVSLKVLRESHGGHLVDNLDDIEGYVEIARQICDEEERDAFSADSPRS